MAKAKAKAAAIEAQTAGVGDGIVYVDGEGTEHSATVTEAYDGGSRISCEIAGTRALKHDVIHASVTDEEDGRVGRWKSR